MIGAFLLGVVVTLAVEAVVVTIFFAILGGESK